MAIMVTCSNCGKTLQAKDDWAGKNVRCPGCQQVLTVPGLKGGPPPAPVKAKAPARPAPEEDEDQPVARRRRDDDDEAPRRRKGGGGGPDLSELKEFSPGMVIVLTLVTCGLFPAIWIPMLHGKLPKERDNDPSFGTALVFLLVPVLNMFY